MGSLKRVLTAMSITLASQPLSSSARAVSAAFAPQPSALGTSVAQHQHHLTSGSRAPQRLAVGPVSRRLLRPPPAQTLGCSTFSPLLLKCVGLGLGLSSCPTSASAWALRASHSGARSTTCTMEVEQFPCLSDNYGYLIHDASTGLTACIDTPEVEPIMEALSRKGWTLTHILNTHHHHDHAGGNLELKKLTNCRIFGPAGEASKIPGIDVKVDQGDVLEFGSQKAKVINVGGHTHGHIAFYFEDQGIAFVGDSLFAMGCGRKFEGTFEQMYTSLQRLAALPDETVIYCAHEYTQANAKFALSVEPGNKALQSRSKEVQELRSAGKPTVPTVMKIEKETNPFLRWDSPEIRSVLGLKDSADGLEVFTATRKAKDKF